MKSVRHITNRTETILEIKVKHTTYNNKVTKTHGGGNKESSNNSKSGT